MSKKKRREPKIECIAYISVEGDLNKIDRLEAKQERYIREYANAHNIDIVGVEYRHGFGQMDVNRQINAIAGLIRAKRVQVSFQTLIKLSQEIILLMHMQRLALSRQQEEHSFL